MRERLPLPRAIQNAPDLWLGLELYYGAFLDLTTCRQTGWGSGPIPWTAINEYARAYRIRGGQRDDLFYFVSAMDRAYLEFCEKKAAAAKR